MSMIGRLRLAAAMWWLWRRCDWVYRWAHHPLCGRFREDVWRIGAVHVCRSCTLLYVSAFASAGAAWCMAGGAWAWGVLWGLMLVVLPLSHPSLYHRQSRLARDALRCGAGVIAGLLVVMLARGEGVAGAATITLLTVVYVGYQRSRRRVLACACEGCLELDSGRICSGFRLQSERILACEPLATELVMRSGCFPPLPAGASATGAAACAPPVPLRVHAIQRPSAARSTSPEP